MVERDPLEQSVVTEEGEPENVKKEEGLVVVDKAKAIAVGLGEVTADIINQRNLRVKRSDGFVPGKGDAKSEEEFLGDLYPECDDDGDPSDCGTGSTAYDPGNISQQQAAANAENNYTNRIAAGQGTPENYYGRSHARLNQGDFEGARSDALQVLKVNPDDPRATAIYKLSERKMADQELNTQKPDFGATEKGGEPGLPGGGGGPSTNFEGGGEIAYGRRDPAAVARALNSVAGRPPREQSMALAREAFSALRVKDHSAVMTLTEQALKLDPGNTQALYVRATARLQAQDYSAAIAEADQGLRLAPDSRPLLAVRALANNKAGNYRAGLGDALSILRVSARDAVGYYNKAYSEAGLKQFQESRSDLKNAAILSPRYRPKYMDSLKLADDELLTAIFDETAPGKAADDAGPAKKSSRLPLWLIALGGAILLGFGLLSSPAIRERTSVLLRGGSAEPAGEVPPSMEPRADEPQAPASLADRYEYKRNLGEGGMGIVFEALDRRLDRRVAVKKMRDEIRLNPRERERFLQEARTVAKLRHPNIVEIYSVEEEGEDAYLVFEFVEGKNLYELISEQGRLGLGEAQKLLKGVCDALEYAHQHNVIHRDLKPANIMVDKDGVVRVMDFGIARQVSDALARQSMTKTVIGTPAYMAPEQEQGVVRREADIYALGVCLYEALSGNLPFSGTPGAAMLSKLEAKYAPVREAAGELPAAVETLIRRALEPDADQRIHSAADFYQELSRAAAVSGVQPILPPPATQELPGPDASSPPRA